MKTTLRFVTVITGSVFILALFSFTRNQFNINDLSNSKKTNEKITQASPVMLMSNGANKFSYSQDGTLLKVTTSDAKEIRYATTEDRGIKSYTASIYRNGIITNRYVYKIGLSGLASEIFSEQFDDGKPWLSWRDTCIYNSAGQLVKQVSGNGNYDFIYDGNGDLSNIMYYNYDHKLFKNITIQYTAINSPLLNDQSNLLPENLELDIHLPIFGRFSNHLPKRIEYTDYATGEHKSDYSLDYVLDDKGYVTCKKKYETVSGKNIETNSFQYISAM